MNWTRNSWKNFPIKQQPQYSNEDSNVIDDIKTNMSSFPGIVSKASIDKLRSDLIKVQHGKAFLLQGGDCAESFSGFNTVNLTNYFRLFLQMNAVLMEGFKKPVVKIGRIAGQYAKPRSSDMEERNGISLPSYRGDIINSIEFTPEARKPNPHKILETYFYSAATYNFIQNLARGGFASFENISKWNEEFLAIANGNSDFDDIIKKINSHIKFFENCGHSMQENNKLQQADFFTSHEALLLHYEESLVREYNGKHYCLSADQLWIGDRTRKITDAHVEFLRGIENPIGIKVGPTTDVPELVEIIKVLNPENKDGKIILITRMGAEKVNDLLPPIVEKVQKSSVNIIWQVDPMHGNIIKAQNGYKTRRVEDISSEILSFFEIHRKLGTYAGGVHLEMTGNNVTECLGGFQNIIDDDLSKRYHTHCDPRLNSSQSLQIMLQLVKDIVSINI
jgi:3-deoxy-7-phosphoheptulonate synthase